MFNLPCNIEANDRVVRVVFGAVLFIAALLGFGRVFLFLAGIALLAEGIIGWCGVPILIEKFKLNEYFKKKE
jgi:hypothetical protein